MHFSVSCIRTLLNRNNRAEIFPRILFVSHVSEQVSSDRRISVHLFDLTVEVMSLIHSRVKEGIVRSFFQKSPSSSDGGFP